MRMLGSLPNTIQVCDDVSGQAGEPLVQGRQGSLLYMGATCDHLSKQVATQCTGEHGNMPPSSLPDEGFWHNKVITFLGLQYKPFRLPKSS